MGKIKEAVFDAGPFIHLSEIEHLSLTVLFNKIVTTKNIIDECSKIAAKIKELTMVEIKTLLTPMKNFSKYLIEEYDLDLGEATGIALCKQEKVPFFFTDDLEAREVANNLGFKAHGTVGILFRSFREKMITKNEAKELLFKLHQQSSLYFTKDLLDWCVKEIEEYSPK